MISRANRRGPPTSGTRRPRTVRYRKGGCPPGYRYDRRRRMGDMPPGTSIAMSVGSTQVGTMERIDETDSDRKLRFEKRPCCSMLFRAVPRSGGAGISAQAPRFQEPCGLGGGAEPPRIPGIHRKTGFAGADHPVLMAGPGQVPHVFGNIESRAFQGRAGPCLARRMWTVTGQHRSKRAPGNPGNLGGPAPPPRPQDSSPTRRRAAGPHRAECGRHRQRRAGQGAF
eukprot:gene14818-biopygen3623